MNSGAFSSLTVRAPGRLHLGFLDPSATLGRRFGSVGIVISGYETEVELSSSELDTISADTIAAQAEIGRASEYLELIRERTGVRQPMSLRLRRTLPAHAGFGSGTQLALAIGRGFLRLNRIEASTQEIAKWVGRGRRSGVGVAGFDCGGLILDGGPGPSGTFPMLLARVSLPETWRIIIVQDASQSGLSGADEVRAISSLKPLPQAHSADICHRVLMQIFPGAVEAEFDAFASGVNRIQDILGEHFAPAQEGSSWTSERVGRFLQAARTCVGSDRVAIGQSSWGPTGFAIVPSVAAANALISQVRQLGTLHPSITLEIVEARNHGAIVTHGCADNSID